jgi:deoxyribodipyrimidine photo-lyase
MPQTALLWLRRDLRLADNPALHEAMSGFERVLPIYIHAPDEESPWPQGAASRWWLHHSLTALAADLQKHGSELAVVRGPSLETLLETARRVGANAVLWNRLYDPATRERDARIKTSLRASGLRCESHNALLLSEPWETRTSGGEPYRVFSAFWRKTAPGLAGLRPGGLPPRFAPPPDTDHPGGATAIAGLGLLPTIPWDQGLAERWTPGEQGALERARTFVSGPLTDYGQGRDLPAQTGTSSLSPHLHFGEIGPRQLLELIAGRLGATDAPEAEHYVRELVWREFAYHLLYHFPATTDQPLNPQFERFPWRAPGQHDDLEAWQRGRTGVPLVDAGMRELWHTGWMHNRVRMVVASYLTKNLLLPWQEGSRWFWDTLVDADLASNTLGWQWSAGCGADAAPFFRIFNPVRQGERFDPDGAYVRRWCPELSRLPNQHIHQPWAAPEPVLRAAGVRLGRNYPHPLVDLGESRKAALAAYAELRGA